MHKNLIKSDGSYVIAIDGPTASGKGTVAKILAKKFGIIALSTGAIYRAVCIYFMDKHIAAADIEKVTEHVPNINLKVTFGGGGETRVAIDGVDVTERLEDVVTSSNVANYAKIPVVRAKVKSIQKIIASEQSLVCEGRDITSVVFPDAKYKFYLTASVKVRAKRRLAQELVNGEESTLSGVRHGIAKRDRTDIKRKVSPLVRVKDATVINSTHLTAEQTVWKMVEHIRRDIINQNRKNLVIPDDFKKPKGANVFRKIVKVLLFVPLRIVCPSRVKNRAELRKHRGKPIILAFNHRSNFDVVSLFMTFPTRTFHFIGKESLFKNGTFLNWGLRCLNGFPLRPGNDMAVIRHSLNILKCGDSLSIFPEGRRNFNAEDALAVRNGTAMIAIKSGVPVVPIVTNRTPRPFHVTKFRVGETIYPEKYTDKTEFSNALRDQMAKLLDGFEKRVKLKSWDKAKIHNVRGITFIDGKLLLIKRNREGQEYFVFPGGHINEGETARIAAERENREETNVETNVTRLLYKMRMEQMCCGSVGQMQAFYLCQYKSGTVSKTDAEEFTCDPNSLNRCGRPNGTYEPVLVDAAEIGKLDIKPVQIRDQLLNDIQKYGIHLTRPTKFIKTKIPKIKGEQK
jgi:cytidylate kinase